MQKGHRCQRLVTYDVYNWRSEFIGGGRSWTSHGTNPFTIGADEPVISKRGNCSQPSASGPTQDISKTDPKASGPSKDIFKTVPIASDRVLRLLLGVPKASDRVLKCSQTDPFEGQGRPEMVRIVPFFESQVSAEWDLPTEL
jgi:hypothetical protein